MINCVSDVASYNCQEVGVKYVEPEWPNRDWAHSIKPVNDWRTCLKECQASMKLLFYLKMYQISHTNAVDVLRYKSCQASRDCLYWQWGNGKATNALQCINAFSYASKTNITAVNQLAGTKFCYEGD